MPGELVNAIGHQVFHFNLPNVKDSFNMALSQMILHMNHMVNIFILVRDN